MNQPLITIFLLIIFASASGCSLLTGAPKAPIDVNKVSERITQKLENIDTKKEIKSAEDRNEAISESLTLIDLRYSEFINNAGLQQRIKDMTTDFVELSLNLAGAAVGNASTKTLLAALSAGVSGTNIAFDKTFIYESAIPILIMQMNADRTEKYRQIISGMHNEKLNGADGYSWSQAVHDLIDYYNAGTLQNAINTIKKNAGNKQVMEEEKIEHILMPLIATQQDIEIKKKLFLSLDNIKDKNLAEVTKILEPLSKALNHLNGCKTLGTKSDSANTKINVQNVQNALADCIRDVSGETEKGRAFKDDFAEIEKQFKQVGLII
jgi:hypothetical protein